MKILAALYVRVSTLDQDTRAQERELRAFAASRAADGPGWERAEIYREKASGAARSRPVLDHIVGLCRAGKINTVVIWKLDRLGRSMAQLSWLFAEFQRLNVRLISTTEGLDTTEQNPSAAFHRNVLGSVAELTRAQNRERVISGIAAARARGQKFGRPKKTNPEMAAAAAKMKARGKSLEEIAEALGIGRSTAGRLTAAVKVQARPRRFKIPRARKMRVPKTPPENALPALL